MSEQLDPSVRPDATGDTVLEAQFDQNIARHGRWAVSIILIFTVVGILIIPFWLLFSRWYYPEYLRRISARLTTQALEIQKGVFFRTEATIPLNRITDVRLHDGPIMRHYKLRGLRVETAGQSGQNAGSEGNLVGVVDAVALRDAILSQRQKVLDAERPADSSESTGEATEILTEIRDILARIEAQGH